MPYLAEINLVSGKEDFGWHSVIVPVLDAESIKEMCLDRAVRTIVDRKIDRNKIPLYSIRKVGEIRKIQGL